VDEYGFTMHAKEDSEENIVNPDKQMTTTTSSGRQSGDREYRSNDRKGPAGIVKTSSVTVQYDQGEEPTSATTRWAAV
jgi:hypothetical protein